MIKLFEPYINNQARSNVQRILSGHQIAQGPEVDLFEQEFAKTFGFEPWQVVSLNSGTSALELAYQLMHIGPGDEVITPVLTCTATNIPLKRLGAQIVFGDVQGRRHLNMDAKDIEYKISDKTKAIVFVHFGGSSAGLQAIEQLCEDRDIELICDAAQALGARLSTSARFNAVSLQAIKSLTAGDGGVLICRDQGDAAEARKLRWFGYDRDLKQRLGDTDLEIAGYKMHMNDISAAIARGNLSEWDRILSHRKAINAVYARFGSKRGYIEGIWAPQVVGLNYGDTLARIAINEIQIGQYHYPNSKYSIFKYAEAACPMMDKINDSYFLLPCHMGMSLKDAEYVAQNIWV